MSKQTSNFKKTIALAFLGAILSIVFLFLILPFLTTSLFDVISVLDLVSASSIVGYLGVMINFSVMLLIFILFDRVDYKLKLDSFVYAAIYSILFLAFGSMIYVVFQYPDVLVGVTKLNIFIHLFVYPSIISINLGSSQLIWIISIIIFVILFNLRYYSLTHIPKVKIIEKKALKPGEYKNKKTYSVFFPVLISIMIIILVIYIGFLNKLGESLDNIGKLMYLFIIISILTWSINQFLDVYKNNNPKITDDKFVDKWSLGHILRDISIYLLSYYFLRSNIYSIIIVMVFVVVYEFLEALWDKESILNKLSDVLMGVIGCIIAYFLILYSDSYPELNNELYYLLLINIGLVLVGTAILHFIFSLILKKIQGKERKTETILEHSIFYSIADIAYIALRNNIYPELTLDSWLQYDILTIFLAILIFYHISAINFLVTKKFFLPVDILGEVIAIIITFFMVYLQVFTIMIYVTIALAISMVFIILEKKVY